MVTWAMMNNRLITAQAIPPRWPGMVLFLDEGSAGLHVVCVWSMLGGTQPNVITPRKYPLGGLSRLF